MHPLQKIEFASDKANGVPLFEIVCKKAVFAVVAGIVAPIIARTLPEAIYNAEMLLGFLLCHCEKTAGFRGNL